MPRRIRDPEVRFLAGIAGILEPDYTDRAQEEEWRDSPFAWIRTKPSRQKGRIGEQLVAGWCAAKGFDVLRSPDAEADRVIQGRRVEIKFSTLWRSGVYTFQQFREQNYEYSICLGMSPFSAHCWVISKSLLRRHVIGHTPQHMGRRGSDTAWLSFPASDPPSWLRRCGGTLARAARIISSF